MRQLLYVLIAAMSLMLLGCADDSGIKTAPVTGTITVNGKPVPGVHVEIAPVSGDRPSVANTDENGQFKAQFLKDQFGVVPGPCVVKISYIVGAAMVNYLPKNLSDGATEIPELNIVVPKEGLVFDYDVQYAKGELPPQN
ncbi:carboxypeptidase-like regulatory domain-containing protein [Bremerella sp. P1]|uniref:carboxypeptidase-like regulatory domain-containing protein n=1 Tax=Bremerella sp. P1 TaxID=3026424 RepID=UPI0023689E0F|nr:carboxypeptidase-like regulatory domain-containing protein [Bremerella sp. P1]WDI42302.1 carboxypeptidase-like regulatory domain-containing protein [Bremerella sp. P1]